jgi:hypothetical protein
MPTTEEIEILEDEKVAGPDGQTEVAEDAPKEGVEYIEFVGQQPYGVEFTAEHVVTRKQLREAWDVTIPKDLKWTKAEGGPNRGRMLVPVSDMTPEAAAGFENDPLFKLVTLSN